MPHTLHLGDCLDILQTMPDNSVDSVVTDPPYGLSFMGKRWDYDVPSEDIWRECLRVLKPGGHLLAFAGTRTQHRMAVRIEDAGFEIRDMIAWVYGSGFPKSLDVSKAIDKRGGTSVMWFGPWFRKWRNENGVTQKQVAALFPSKTGGLTGCVANWELGLNMPTPEQFNLIRDTFGLPFDSVEEAEREVVGQNPNVERAARSLGGGIGFGAGSLDASITAPATPAARQWHGWGTALKPALEPITVARKPLIGTVAENVLTWGTGGVNVDASRVGVEASDPNQRSPKWYDSSRYDESSNCYGKGLGGKQGQTNLSDLGRWPANLIHDGSEEVVGLFPQKAGAFAPVRSGHSGKSRGIYGDYEQRGDDGQTFYGDSGSAARFFYCAKASKRDRNEGCEGMEAKAAGALNMRTDSHAIANNMNTQPRTNHHPTVKPTDLMRYLCKLVTPTDGTVLDPFMGSGSTGKAAVLEGFNFIGIEREPEYLEIARARITHAQEQKESRLI